MIHEDVDAECELAVIVHEASFELEAVTSARIIAFMAKWGRERAVEALGFLIMAKVCLEMDGLAEEMGI